MHRDEAIYARSDARGGITLTAEEAKAAHEFVWTALLPDRTLSLAERSMGEWVLARLADRLSTTSSP